MSTVAKKSRSAKPSAQPLEAIRSDELLPIEVAQQRLGLGLWAVRQARRKGLKVRRIGRRSYVLGSDLIEYLNAAPPV